jgi:hypothetical protein
VRTYVEECAIGAFFLRSRSLRREGEVRALTALRAVPLQLFGCLFPSGWFFSFWDNRVRTYVKEYRPCTARRGCLAREIFFVNSRLREFEVRAPTADTIHQNSSVPFRRPQYSVLFQNGILP